MTDTALLVANLRRNLAAGARLALFMRVSQFDFRVSPAELATLFGFNFLLAIVGAMLREGFPGAVNLAGVPVYLSQLPLIFLACLAVGAVLGRRDLLLALATALIAGDAVFEIVGTILHHAFGAEALLGRPSIGVVLAYGYVLWGLAVTLRALVVMAGWRGWRSARATGVLAAWFALFLVFLPRSELWLASPEDAHAPPQPSIADESLFHRQQTLLGETLAQLAPQRPGVEDLYFVGVAPYSPEDVFVREVTAVRGMFDARFGTADRSIILANSPQTLADTPIATATNLRAVLDRVAQVMDTEEDVLFLFITTHGDERHSLAFDLPPLNLAQITPTALARMLADSGIKWRVLVVSACYSGGFVEPLKDANTVVITAADAKSTSFGCESGRDFTYFGRAFFNEALARTYSIPEAFEAARRAVTEQERAERLKPSSPQIHIGAGIRSKLVALEQRLALPK